MSLNSIIKRISSKCTTEMEAELEIQRCHLTYNLAERAMKLADMPIKALRRCCAENSTNAHAAKRETLGMTRGQMIEKILVDEYIEEK